MALVSVWIEDGTGYHSYLIDPEAYADATTQLELKWRILTGCSHQGYLAAHAGMLKRIAARLLSALEPPRYLALPAYKSRAQLEYEQSLAQEYERIDAEIQAQERALIARINKRLHKPTTRHYALALASDHDFITAMFALYSQGRSRFI
jgi:hypothetical protein